MKKLKIYFVLLCTGVLFCLSGCTKKESLKSCDELLDDVESAAIVFSQNPTQQTCEDYYDAIEDYYDGCRNIPPSVRALYDAWLSEVDCSVY